MTDTDIKAIIHQELPTLLAQDPLIRDFILRTVSNFYSDRTETDSKFDRILAELERDRQEQAQKWDQNTRLWQEQAQRWDQNTRLWQEQAQKWDQNTRLWQEQAQKWDQNTRLWQEQHQHNQEILARLESDRQEQACQWTENTRQWDENNRKWQKQNQHNEHVLAELQRQNRRYDSTIGALGSRWGLYSEASFRNALKGILEDSFGVEVFNLNDFDQEGEVFGRPDQVEIDIIVKNGLVIVCEIKSSMSKSDMYTFDRKVTFYQKRHQRTANRKLVISPMVSTNAFPVAETLGIEVYSYADSVQNL